MLLTLTFIVIGLVMLGKFYPEWHQKNIDCYYKLE